MALLLPIFQPQCPELIDQVVYALFLSRTENSTIHYSASLGRDGIEVDSIEKSTICLTWGARDRIESRILRLQTKNTVHGAGRHTRPCIGLVAPAGLFSPYLELHPWWWTVGILALPKKEGGGSVSAFCDFLDEASKFLLRIITYSFANHLIGRKTRSDG